MESGDVHSGLVHEPAASRLIADGQARVLVDLRTPAAVAQAIGALTLNAAVFARADRRPRDRDLAAFARAVLAAEQRIATAAADDLAARLPKRIAGDDFAARLESMRRIYLPDGLVTADQLRETLALIRAHQPLPATSECPRRRSCSTSSPCAGPSAPRRGADCHPEGGQQPGRLLQRQADDVAEGSLEPGHQRAARPWMA